MKFVLFTDNLADLTVPEACAAARRAGFDGLDLTLRPGGHVVITVRPWREHGELIDLPTQIMTCAEHAGLVVTERAVALLGRVTDTGAFVARGSFFQRDYITKQRRAGLPLHLLAHEDVILAVKPPPNTPGGATGESTAGPS